MQAHITQHGLLVITPETTTEAFALKSWEEKATVRMEDLMRNETTYIRGTSITISIPEKHK